MELVDTAVIIGVKVYRGSDKLILETINHTDQTVTVKYNLVHPERTIPDSQDVRPGTHKVIIKGPASKGKIHFTSIGSEINDKTDK